MQGSRDSGRSLGLFSFLLCLIVPELAINKLRSRRKTGRAAVAIHELEKV